MKTNITLLCLFLGFSLQAQEKFENPTSDCAKYKSLYYQYLRQGQYLDAKMFWVKAYEKCSESNELDYKMFKNGRVIFDQLKKKLIPTDSVQLKWYTDTLQWIYNEGLNYIKEDAWKYDYAGFLISEKKYEKSVLVDSLMDVMYQSSELPSPSQIERYFRWKLLNKNIEKDRLFVLTGNEALGLYCQLSAVCHRGMETSKDSVEYVNTDLRMRISLSKIAPKNDMALDQIKYLKNNRSLVKSVLKSQLNRDLELLEMCDKMSSEYYTEISLELLSAFPTADGFSSFAHVNYMQGKYEAAIEYYEKAIANTDDSSVLDIWRYKLALSYYGAKEYQKAFKYAKLVEGEHKAEALIICGDCIAALANSCGDSSFERKANYWLANDYYKKAKTLGLNASGSEYLKNAPSANEIFEQGLSVGDPFYLDCWKESTLIR